MPGRSDISDREEALRLARNRDQREAHGLQGMYARALLSLAADLEAAEERLTAYETPGWINSVQKVMEERRRAEAAERNLATAREALEFYANLDTWNAVKSPETTSAWQKVRGHPVPWIEAQDALRSLGES